LFYITVTLPQLKDLRCEVNLKEYIACEADVMLMSLASFGTIHELLCCKLFYRKIPLKLVAFCFYCNLACNIRILKQKGKITLTHPLAEFETFNNPIRYL
jgi:hypothetical protein